MSEVKSSVKYLGSLIETVTGVSGIVSLFFLDSSIQALNEPYKTLGKIGQTLLGVVSVYFLGKGLYDYGSLKE